MNSRLCLFGDFERHILSDSSDTVSLYDTTGSDFYKPKVEIKCCDACRMKSGKSMTESMYWGVRFTSHYKEMMVLYESLLYLHNISGKC